MLNDRISELKAARDQAHLAAERGSGRDSTRRTEYHISGACRRIGTIAAATAAITSAGRSRSERTALHGTRTTRPREFFAPAPLNYATGQTAAMGRGCVKSRRKNANDLTAALEGYDGIVLDSNRGYELWKMPEGRHPQSQPQRPEPLPAALWRPPCRRFAFIATAGYHTMASRPPRPEQNDEWAVQRPAT
jgi:hypothetical protein